MLVEPRLKITAVRSRNVQRAPLIHIDYEIHGQP